MYLGAKVRVAAARCSGAEPGSTATRTWQGSCLCSAYPAGAGGSEQGLPGLGHSLPFSSQPRKREKRVPEAPLLPPPLKLPCSCPLAPTGKRAQCWVLELKIWAGVGQRSRRALGAAATQDQAPSPHPKDSQVTAAVLGLRSVLIGSLLKGGDPPPPVPLPPPMGKQPGGQRPALGCEGRGTASQESVAGNSPEKGFSPVPTPVGREGGTARCHGKGRCSPLPGAPPPSRLRGRHSSLSNEGHSG